MSDVSSRKSVVTLGNSTEIGANLQVKMVTVETDTVRGDLH